MAFGPWSATIWLTACWKAIAACHAWAPKLSAFSPVIDVGLQGGVGVGFLERQELHPHVGAVGGGAAVLLEVLRVAGQRAGPHDRARLDALAIASFASSAWSRRCEPL